MGTRMRVLEICGSNRGFQFMGLVPTGHCLPWGCGELMCGDVGLRRGTHPGHSGEPTGIMGGEVLPCRAAVAARMICTVLSPCHIAVDPRAAGEQSVP